MVPLLPMQLVHACADPRGTWDPTRLGLSHTVCAKFCPVTFVFIFFQLYNTLPMCLTATAITRIISGNLFVQSAIYQQRACGNRVAPPHRRLDQQAGQLPWTQPLTID